MVRAEYGTWKHCKPKRSEVSVHTGPRGTKCWGVSTKPTNRLHGLEEAVKDQVPDDLPLLKWRHVPDQEVRQHRKRSRAKDPGKRRVEDC